MPSTVTLFWYRSLVRDFLQRRGLVRGPFSGLLAAHEILRIVRARRNFVSFDLRALREFLLDLAARLALRVFHWT